MKVKAERKERNLSCAFSSPHRPYIFRALPPSLLVTDLIRTLDYWTIYLRFISIADKGLGY